MADAFFPYMVLWAAILAYFLLASIDFASGLYHLLSLPHPRGEDARRALRSYIGPRWEVTNVFLIMIVVGAAAFFPGLVAVLGTVLLIPVMLVVVLFVVRAAFLVFDYFAGENRLFGLVYAVAGLLILPMLSVVLTLIVSNPVVLTGGVPTFDVFSPLSSPVTYVTALLTFFGQILLSGALGRFYDEHPEDAELYRMPVLISVAAVAALGLVELSLLRSNAGYAYTNMVGLAPVMVGTGLLFTLGGFLIWRGKRTEAPYAFLLLVGVDALALMTFAAAHYPYLIYPDVTATDALASPAMLDVLTITLAIGLVIVVPSLLYLNYLYRSEKTY